MLEDLQQIVRRCRARCSSRSRWRRSPPCQGCSGPSRHRKRCVGWRWLRNLRLAYSGSTRSLRTPSTPCITLAGRGRSVDRVDRLALPPGSMRACPSRRCWRAACRGTVVSLPELHRLGAQHEVREVDVPGMRRHVRTLGHVAHVAQVALVDDLARNPSSSTASSFQRRALVDQIEQRRKRGAQVEAAPAAVADVVDALELVSSTRPSS